MQLSEFRDLLANDGFAATFQTMGQYRTELLRALDGFRAQADARPAGHFFKASRVHPWVQVEKECQNAVPLYTHPEASAPGLSEPAFWISKSDADWLERVPNVNGQIQALRLGGASRVPVFLTRASAATVGNHG